MTPEELLGNPTTPSNSTITTPKQGVSPSQVLQNPGTSAILGQGRAGLRGYGDSNFLQNLTAEANPEAVKAANQGFWSELANSAIQTGTNVLGTGINTVLAFPGLDHIINAVTKSEQQFGNTLSDYVNKLNKNFNKEVVPVYNNPETKDVSEWMFENLPSLGTSIGMLLPVLGEVKMLGLAAKAAKGFNFVNKIAGAAKGIETGSEAFARASSFTDALLSAGLSRHAENMMEGTDAGMQAYQDAINKGYTERYAKQVQLKAQQDTYNRNWPLVALDLMQFGIAFRTFKGLSRAGNEFERQALNSSRARKLGTVLGGEVAPEGFEEAYQYIQSQEAVRNAKVKFGVDKDDYSTMSERLKDYVAGDNADELWTSTFFGALGGGAFAAIANRSETTNNNKQSLIQSQIKSLIAQQNAVYEKDPVKFAKASNEELYTYLFNAIENRRADDARNMIEALKNNKLENLTEEDKKEVLEKADFALQKLDEYSKLYDQTAPNNSPEVTRYIMANRANFSNIAQAHQVYTSEFNKNIVNISTEHGLTSDFSKLLDSQSQLKALDELQKSPDFKIDKDIFDLKRSILEEQIKQFGEAVKTNFPNEKIEDRFNKIDKSLLQRNAINKVASELHLAQNSVNANKANTTAGKEEIKKEVQDHREKSKDREFSNLVESIKPDSKVSDIQALRESADKLGKKKEFESEYNKKLIEYKSNSAKFDPVNIATSLKARYTNNPLLREHELNNIGKVAMTTGGLPVGGTLDEDAISALAITNPIFAAKVNEYFKNSGSIVKVTESNIKKVPTTSSDNDANVDATKEKDKAQDLVSPSNTFVAWLTQGYQFEYNKDTKTFDTTKVNESNIAKKIDWRYLNSGSIPIGATLHYEYDYNDEWNKKNKDNKVALFEITYYDSKGNRHVVGVLTGYNEGRTYTTKEEGNALKALREQLWKEIQSKPKLNIVQLDTTTKLKRYLSSNPWNTKTYNSPLDVLKPDQQFIIAIAKTENGKPVLAFNGNPIEDKVPALLGGTSGSVYMIIENSATKQYYPYKLLTQKLNTNTNLHQYVTNEIREFERTTPNKKELIKKLEDIVYFQDINYTNGMYNLTIGDIKNPTVITVNAQDLENVVGNLVLQVDVTKINRDYNGESYNKQLAQQGFISTDLNPNEHFHSTNIQIEPYEPKTTFEQGELTITGQSIPTTNSVSVDQNKPQKIKNAGTTAIELGVRLALAKEGVFVPIDEEGTKQWFTKNLPQVPVNFVDNLIEINKNGGQKAWGMFKDGAITLANASPNGTGQHEAFHAVFNLFLSNKQKEDILNELVTETGIKRSFDKGEDGTRFSAIDYNEYFAKRYNPITRYTGPRNKAAWLTELGTLISRIDQQSYINKETTEEVEMKRFEQQGNIVPITIRFLENIRKNAQHSTTLDKPFGFKDATPEENRVLGKFYDEVIQDLKDKFGDKPLPKAFPNDRLVEKLAQWLNKNYGLQTFSAPKDTHPYGLSHILSNSNVEVKGGEVFIADKFHFPSIASGHNKYIGGTRSNTIGWFIENEIDSDLFLYEFQSDILPEIESGEFKFSLLKDKGKNKYKISVGGQYSNNEIEGNTKEEIKASIKQAIQNHINTNITVFSSDRLVREKAVRERGINKETRYSIMIEYLSTQNTSGFIQKLLNEANNHDPNVLYEWEKKLGGKFNIILEKIPHTTGDKTNLEDSWEYNGEFFEKSVIRDYFAGVADNIGKVRAKDTISKRFKKESRLSDFNRVVKKLEIENGRLSLSQIGKAKFEEKNPGSMEKYYIAREKAMYDFFEKNIGDAIKDRMDDYVDDIYNKYILAKSEDEDIDEKGVPIEINLDKLQEDYEYWYKIMFEKFIKIALKKAKDSGRDTVYLPTFAAMHSIEGSSKTGRIYTAPQEGLDTIAEKGIDNGKGFDIGKDHYSLVQGALETANHDLLPLYYKNAIVISKDEFDKAKVQHLKQLRVGPFYAALSKVKGINIVGLEKPNWSNEKLLKVDLTNYNPTSIERFSAINPDEVYQTNDLKLEEILANRFQDYVQNEGNDTGLGYNIKQFFAKLWQSIKSLFTDEVNIDGLFQRINTGYYKNKPLPLKYKGTNYSVQNTNPFVVKESIDTINYQFFKALDELRNEYSLGDLNDIQLLKKINSNAKDALNSVYQRVYNGLFQAYMTDPTNKGLEDILANFFTINNGEITGTGDYYGLAIQDLAKYGIIVKESRIEAEQDSGDLDDNIPSDNISQLDEDQVKDNIYQVSASFINPKDNISFEVKKTLRQLEKYKYDSKSNTFIQPNDLKNHIGFKTFVNYDEIQNYLQKNISNIFDVDEMMNQLHELQYYRPEIYGLINKLNENDTLRTKFFSDFAKVYLPYMMMQQKSIVNNQFMDEYGNPEKSTKFTLFNANRKSINQLVIDDWNTNLISFRNDVTEKDGTINKDKALVATNEYNSLVESYRKLKEITPELAVKFSDSLNKFGITVTPQVFINEFQARSVYENGKRIQRDSYQNLLNLLAGSQSFTTLLSNISQGTNPYQGNAIESATLRKLTGAIARTEQNLHQDNITNSNGDTKYSYLNPTFIHKKVSELQTEEGRLPYINNWWFKSNKWLQELNNPENEELRNNFEILIFDSIKFQNKDISDEYSGLTTKELAIVDINLYDNPSGKEKDKYGFYRTPIITGSSLAPIVRFLKYSKADIVESFYQLALTERQRIQNLGNLDITIKNLNKNGKNYQFVDIFNTKPEALDAENTAKEAIEEWMQTNFNEEQKRLVYEEVITSVGNFGNNIDQNRHNKSIDDYSNKLEEYFYNVSFAKAMMIQLFHIDPSYYKNSNDFQKRAGQIMKVTRMLDTKASYNKTIVGDTYKTIYILDEEQNGAEITDSQTYLSVDRRRKIGIGLGQWNENNEKGYDLIKKGIAFDDSFTQAFTPLKPFYYNHEEVGDWIIPVQIKNSEITLTKNFTKNNPKLESIRKYIDPRGIDSVVFVSAVKAGQYGAVSYEDLKAGKEPVIHTAWNKYYGIQTEIPNHHLNTDILAGTQQKKLITADIPEDAKFFNGTMNKQEIYNAYQKLLTANIIDSYNQIADEFQDIDKIQRILLDEVQQRGLGDSFRKALEIKNDINGNKVFNIPLFDPIFGQKMQNVLNAIIRNNITKQRINGGSFVYASSFGIVKPKTSDQLKLIRDKDGTIKYYEVMLPAWMSSFLPRNPKGEVEFDSIKEEAPGLLEMFGYFIPTEGKNSMMAANLVGFVPDIEGGIAIFPPELVAISGKDFDKDEVYIMIPNHKIENGKLQKVRYDLNHIDDLTKEQRDNAIIDISREIWSHPSSTPQIEKNSNFDELKELRDEVKERYHLYNDNANPIFPASDAAFYERSTTGATMLPIAAINKPAHALLQYTDVKFKNDFMFDGEKSRSVSHIESLDGKELVSDNFAEFLAAMADNDKEPTAGYLNLNEYTVNAYLGILHTGFQSKTGIYLINQPVIRRLYKGYTKYGSTKSGEQSAIKAIKDKLISIVGEDIPHNIYMLRTDSLKNQMNPLPIEGFNKDDAKEQLKVLYTFLKYKDLGDSLSSLILAAQSDKAGVGKSMSENHYKLDRINKVREDDNLINQSDLLDEIPLIQVSTEYGLKKPQEELLSQYLPFDGELFTNINDAATLYKNNNLTAKEIKYLYTQFIHWYVSGFDFFKDVDKERYVTRFPKVFNDLKSEISMSKYELMKYLRYIPVNERNDVPRIEFTSGATVSDEQRDLIRQSWEAILASSNEKEVNLAKNLIKYAYYTTNFGFTYSGFSHLIPTTYFENIQNSEGFSYRDYLYKLMEEKDNGLLVAPFLEELYRNNDQKGGEKLLRTIRSNQITNKAKSKKGVVPSIMFNTKTAKDQGIYDSEEENSIPLKYLRFENPNSNIYTYKYSGFTSDGNIIYNILSNKGYENHITEFNRNYPSKDSVLPNNKLPEFEEKDYFSVQIQSNEDFAQIVKEREEGTNKVDQQLTSILNQFAASLGVQTKYVTDLKTRTGQSARGIADIFSRLILISQGKEKSNTLPEEVGHFAEAYMRHDPAHKTLMSMIGQTETYQNVISEYGEQYLHDEEKLKQEAIGQLIGEAIIKRDQDRRNKSNNIVLQFLEGIWRKFLSIFKKADPQVLMTDINSIVDYIADQVLDQNIDAFKVPNKIKLGETFYSLGDDSDIKTAESALEDSIDSINKKIKIYSEKGSEAFAKSESSLLTKLQKDYNDKSFELGLLRYVANARIELRDVAKRYNNIKSSTPDTVEEKRELLNQLRAAKNYVNGFRETLNEIAKLSPFNKAINSKIAQTSVMSEALNDDYLRLGKTLVADVLKTFSTNPSLDIKQALNILDGDISFFQRWLDAMAETSDPILGILDNMTKDAKEIGRRKTLSLSKDIIDEQKNLEKSGIKSTSFFAERDFAGNLTGNRVKEYNYGEYYKQKKNYFRDHPKPTRDNFGTNSEYIDALKTWRQSIAEWFEENNQPHPDRESIIKAKKDYFNGKYTNPRVAREKYNDWLFDNIKEVWGWDELGQTIETSFRGELSIPSVKYKSKQWEDIQGNSALKEYTDNISTILDDLDRLLPDKYKLNGKLPQVRKDFYERLYFTDETGKKKLKSPTDIAKESRKTIAESFTRNENDIEFGLTDENNLPINFIPVYWTRRLDDPSNISTDITSSVIAFGSSVYDFQAMSSVLGTLEAAQDILAERAVLTGKWDPVTLMSKITKNVNGKNVKVKPITKEGKNSLSHARLKDYMEMVVFGHAKEAGMVINGIDVAKVMDQINRYTALNSLAGNIYTGISNVTFGTALERTEAIANEFYGNKELAYADKEYTKDLVNTLGDIGQRQASSYINLWEEIHNTLQNYNREFKDIDAGRSTIFSRLMKESSLYFLNHAGEHYMQIRSSIALANKIQVRTKEGQVIPYYEAYDRVNVGTENEPSYRLKLKEGLTKVGNDNHGSLFRKNEDGKPLTDRDIRRFINRQNFLNKRLHGIYNSVDASAVQKFALGRIAIMFRKYLKPGWNRRWAKLTYNEEGEIYTEGNYTTMFRFMGGLVSDIAKLKFSIVKNFKNLTDGEKANLIRSAIEVSYMLGAVALGAALTQMADDDDDNWALNLAAYEAYRLYSELRLYSSLTEAQRLLKSPAAAVNQWDAINRFLQVWNWGKEYESGRYKGMNHFERGLTDLTPFVGTYFKFRTPEEQLRYFTNTGVTIF